MKALPKTQAQTVVLMANRVYANSVADAEEMAVQIPYHDLMFWAERYGCNNPRRFTNMLKGLEPWEQCWDTDFNGLTRCYCCGNVVEKAECRIEMPNKALVCSVCETREDV